MPMTASQYDKIVKTQGKAAANAAARKAVKGGSRIIRPKGLGRKR